MNLLALSRGDVVGLSITALLFCLIETQIARIQNSNDYRFHLVSKTILIVSDRQKRV